jgi:hypothetical protein
MNVVIIRVQMGFHFAFTVSETQQQPFETIVDAIKVLKRI